MTRLLNVVLDLPRFGADTPELRASPDPAAACALVHLMVDISEEYYCAGWLDGLEDRLWDMVCGGSRDFGMGEVTDAEVSELRRLSVACHGWWFWRDGDAEFGETFVGLDEWQAESGVAP